jgi:eukaryotic-like serine/threonine-protein kinase
MMSPVIPSHSFQPPSDPWLGRSIGEGDRYRLEERLGSGGMGDVFLATDLRLGKPVALKLLKESLAIAEDLDLRARFERECSICAALKSQHIVQVSDYGVTSEGYPFYVMEYLQGQTLADVLVQPSRFSVSHTCNIITQVCAGLQLAHTGVDLWNRETNTNEHIKVVHRDLKPANIFLVPTALGELAKIIDFGIAKIHSLQTEYSSTTGIFLGTCHYAPPEQFNIQSIVDERADIYSLGVILYEMLTGTDPFGFGFPTRKITNEMWLTAHAAQMPTPLRSHPNCDDLSPDLEAIVLRCLEKSPSDRFPSVAELSHALQALNADAPTIVRPNALTSVRRPENHSNGETQRRSTTPPLTASQLQPKITSTNPLLASQPSARKFPWVLGGSVMLAIAIALYGVPRFFRLPQLTPSSPLVRIGDSSQLTLVETLSGQTQPALSAILSPDGKTLISGGEVKDTGDQFYSIQIWDIQTQKVLRSLNGHRGEIYSLYLSPDGKTLVSGSTDRTIKLWDMETGNLLRTLEGHTAPIWSVVLSQDGQTVISGGADKTVRIWDLKTNRNRILSEHIATVYSVTLNQDETIIASSGEDKTIRLWNAQTGELMRTMGEPGGHRDTIRAIAFSPDGQQIASASWDGKVKLWSAINGQLIQTFEGHTDQVVAVTFLSNQAIATASLDHTIKIWQPPNAQPIQTLSEHTDAVLSISSHPTDQTLISTSNDTTIRIWR